MNPAKGEVTELLERLAAGDSGAADALLPQVYAELHRIASVRMRGERPGHTLQATALVNEAYLRLCKLDDIDWRGRAHFFAMAGRLMRQILIDHARQHGASKRGSGYSLVPLEGGLAISSDQLQTVLELDEVLQRLARRAPRQAQVVEMRFFAGLQEKEIAEILQIHCRTVRREWESARAWLHQELSPA